MASDEISSPELDKLPPDVRTKVQDALKATLEQQLAAVAGRGGIVGLRAAAHSRSQGAFFSRSKTTDSLRPGDDMIAQKVAALDDAAFDKFAARLSTLKKINRS